VHALSLLNKELAARGFHRKPTGLLLAQLAVLVAMSLGGTAVFVLADGIVLRLMGLLVMAMGNLGITTHSHTSSHNGTSRRLWVNKALTYFGFGMIFGTSTTWWWNKHIAVHHPTPNVIGLDDDVDLLPWFALTEEEFRSGGPLRRLYYRWQWVALPLALGLTAVNMMLSSIQFLAAALRDRSRRTALHWIDLGVLAAHYGLWIGVPLLWFSAWQVVGFYLLRGALLGYAVFSTAAPAHFPAEAGFLTSDGHRNRAEYRRHSDYLLLQTVTTVNFRTGRLGRFLCCGSDYQLEHHLFPGIAHTYYPQISPILREFCEANGYPYRTLGWWEGIVKSLAVFVRPKPVEPALEALLARARTEQVPSLTA
jgi:linoleoyl-CoA desaturase